MQHMEKPRMGSFIAGVSYLLFICLSYTTWYLLSIFAFNLIFSSELLLSMDLVVFGFSPLFALGITMFSLSVLKRHGQPKFAPYILVVYSVATSVLIYYSVIYSILPRI
ncbi:hypothetical protein D3D03_05125 [Exiguobacterium sp. RIT452]|uniref:hypothetical protein n=1 Tax=Exiguobacterium TaxID=33986 RepID=UPI000E74F909|nr:MULTISPECIES: hypothetical protein [unclassified Exiguobacterium]RJP02729.1 hypothetical protein D3D03_05125 [Exiguobacterium sp. RIT452]